MELTQLQLKQLKECELEMLRSFKEICDKLGIKYYILGGTLLGAVRHKGFIPWDDDVDVFIPRKEYEIFLEKAQSLMPEKYFLQTHLTDENYPNNFAKMRDSSTTFIEKTCRHIDMNHGVYIDIFPLDFYPDGIKGKIFSIKKKLLTWRINRAFDFGKQSLKSKIAAFISTLVYPSLKKAVLKREKLYGGVTEGGRVINNSGAWEEKEIVPASWCGEGVPLEFEGLSMRGPDKYDEWLTFVYGDYMALPPEEERVPHHFVEAFDIDKPYTEYFKK